MFSDFQKQKEVQDCLNEVLQESKRRISKEQLKEYLKKKDEVPPKQEETNPTIEKTDDPVQITRSGDNVEIKITQEETQSNHNPELIEKLLDDYEEAPKQKEMTQTNAPWMVGGGVGRKEVDDAIRDQSKYASFSNLGVMISTNVNDAIFEAYYNTTSAGLDWQAVSANYYNRTEVDNTIYDNAQYGSFNNSGTTMLSTNINDAILEAYLAISTSAGTDWPTVSANYYNKCQTDTLIFSATSAAEEWTIVSADYYDKSQTNNLIISATSATEAWTTVSANYYNKTEVENGTPSFQLMDMNVSAHSAANPAYQEGRLFWDYENHTLAMYNDNSEVTLQLGQEEYLRVVNRTGVAIPNGTFVRINGALGDRPTVIPVMATSGYGPDGTIGCTTHHLSNGETGYVTVTGVVNGLNTSGYSIGSPLFLSETVSGGYQITPPNAPNATVFVGIVLRSHQNTGKIFVTIRTTPRLTSLSDVDGTTPSTGCILQYQGSYWDPVPFNNLISAFSGDTWPTVSANYFTSTQIQNGTVSASFTTLKLQNFKRDHTTVTSSYVISASTYNHIVANNTSDITITLPTATGSGNQYTISSINIGNVTVSGTINGETSQSLIKWDSMTVEDVASGVWLII